ncbi:MAG: hypothetical protein N2B05_03255, partial [Gemmatimonadales bacterium]
MIPARALAAGVLALALAGAPGPLMAQDVEVLHSEIDRLAADISSDVIVWRRDLHQNPELGNREFR